MQSSGLSITKEPLLPNTWQCLDPRFARDVHTTTHVAVHHCDQAVHSARACHDTVGTAGHRSESICAGHRASRTLNTSCPSHWTRMVGTVAFDSVHRNTLLHRRQCCSGLSAKVVFFPFTTHVRRIPGPPLAHILSPIDVLTFGMILIE